MPELSAHILLNTQAVAIRDVICQGTHQQKSAEETSRTTHLVFPYRGVYIHHLGTDDAVAEANQVLFFNASEAYRVSHPVRGGDASLSIWIDEELQRQLAPKHHVREGRALRLRPHRLRIDPRAQALVAVLRW